MSLVKKLGTKAMPLTLTAGPFFGGMVNSYAQSGDEMEFIEIPYLENLAGERGVNAGVDVTTAMSSLYRTKGGFTLSEGPVQQTNVGVSFRNLFMKGDSLTPYAWSNFDIDRKAFTEVDLAATYAFPISDRFLNGSLDASVEAGAWVFPGDHLGPETAYGITGRLNYSGNANVDFEMIQALNYGKGRQFAVTVSKPLVLAEDGEERWSFTPLINCAYHDGFFDKKGFSSIQWGLSFDYNAKDWGVNASLVQQAPLSEEFEHDEKQVFKLGFIWSPQF